MNRKIYVGYYTTNNQIDAVRQEMDYAGIDYIIKYNFWNDEFRVYIAKKDYDKYLGLRYDLMFKGALA